MGLKTFLNSVLQSTHYRLVNRDDYERIFAAKDAGVSAAGSLGRSMVDDLLRLYPADRPLTLFDVGANKGGTYRLFRSMYPKAHIHCFEPDPRVLEKLRTQAADDALTQCHPLAVSDTNGKLEFHLTEAAECNSLLVPAARDILNQAEHVISTIPVTSVTLDTFAAQHGIDRIDLLKMDIQGAEVRALDGATGLLKDFRIGALYLELVFGASYRDQALASDIIDYLQRRRYRVSAFYNLVYGPDSGVLGYCDGLFVANSPAK
ncbi:MAG: FkbM family methyltransferase [Verrucomicrobiota bacterium]